MNPVVSPRHPPSVGQPLLRALELFAIDDGRHGRHGDPLGRVVHAEMETLLSCARRGIPTVDATI